MVHQVRVGRNLFDFEAIITYWAVPPGVLREGRNELRIHCTGKASDDVMIGEVTVIDRPRDAVLSEAHVEVAVVEEPGGRPVASRITIANGGTCFVPDAASSVLSS